MEIYYFDSLPSTHTYALEQIRKNKFLPPFVVYAKKQTDGIGSRGNIWESFEDNLHVSFCVKMKHLPFDLPAASISIYVGMVMKEILNSLGSQVWLKWPNDFYINNLKIGGVMGIKTLDVFIVSIGVNLHTAPLGFGVLDISISPRDCVQRIIEALHTPPSWKNIFSKYKLEFEYSKKFSSHIGEEYVSLSMATLCEDGSIIIGNKKVYNLR
ncbi:MAG: biotin--[acetyl-CoA-carboxylase] ligase [Campylobacteraceae bacterium]|nr:biotin--[acetyl-CoA-carboxylase] ligase [Campylobacteraceae bacterium]